MSALPTETTVEYHYDYADETGPIGTSYLGDYQVRVTRLTIIETAEELNYDAFGHALTSKGERDRRNTSGMHARLDKAEWTAIATAWTERHGHGRVSS